MSDSLVILPSVAHELEETLRARLETGRDLLAELAMMFNKIRERPRRYPIAYEQVHRALTPRFHFAIFFEIVDKRREVIILAALHQWRARDPATWPRRSVPRLWARRQSAPDRNILLWEHSQQPPTSRMTPVFEVTPRQQR